MKIFLRSVIALSIIILAAIFVPYLLTPSVSAQSLGCVVTKVGNPTSLSPTFPPGCVTTVRGPVLCSEMTNYDCAYKHIMNYTSICCRWTGVGAHEGVDIMAPLDTPQYALEDIIIQINTFNGCVQPSVWNAEKPHPGAVSGPGGGRVCIPADDTARQKWTHGRSTGWSIYARGIKSKRNYYYFHMSKKSPVAENSIVKAGNLIGYTGRTGHSPGGSHLHLQVSLPDCSGCWRNPDVMLGNFPNL